MSVRVWLGLYRRQLHLLGELCLGKQTSRSRLGHDQSCPTLTAIPWRPFRKAPPKWGRDRWGCENCPFNIFFGDALWKVSAQERDVGFLVSEKTWHQARQWRRDSMKWLNQPWFVWQLPPNVGQQIFSISCASLVCWYQHGITNHRPSSRRRLFLVSHSTQIHAERGREQSCILFLFLGEFSLKRLVFAERTATKPLRVKHQIEFRVIPCVSVCFRLFPSVSVSFRLALSGNCAVHHRDPCPGGSGAVQMQGCSACKSGCQRLRCWEGADLRLEIIATLRHGTPSSQATAKRETEQCLEHVNSKAKSVSPQLKGVQTMKCKLWTETLEFSRSKVPNSRFALHGLAL